MNYVCDALNINRESVRRWKNEFRSNGLNGLLFPKHKEKKYTLSNYQIIQLKKIISNAPSKSEIKADKWTGALIIEIVFKKWNINITLRTAQYWLKNLK